MSEKATLLTSIPPVGKSAPVNKAPVLTGIDQSSTSNQVTEVTEAVEGIASVADAEQTITAFQGAIYASFVLTFCLAGFAAVVLFRKAAKIVEARFVMGAKALAAASGLIALHGFFATYLYANYLNGEGAAPLFVMVALWAFVGPAVAVVLNYLLTPGSVPEKGAVVFDAGTYFAIFVCAAIALIPSVTKDAALIFSLIGGFLFIVPVARSVAVFRKAKIRHPELRETSDKVLIYTLLFLPALLPLVVLGKVCNMSSEVTLFLFNFITFDFILIAGLAMLASADGLAAEAEPAASVEEAAPVVEPPQPAVVEFSAPSQPKPKKRPPHKPAKVVVNPALPPAPRKPGSAPTSSGAPAASNAPSRVKAPSKPKKRF